MTHLNFSVEQHGSIYILLSGNVSTFFSSLNIEKIQKRLKYLCYTFPGHKLRASAPEYNSTALQLAFPHNRGH